MVNGEMKVIRLICEDMSGKRQGWVNRDGPEASGGQNGPTVRGRLVGFPRTNVLGKTKSREVD